MIWLSRAEGPRPQLASVDNKDLQYSSGWAGRWGGASRLHGQRTKRGERENPNDPEAEGGVRFRAAEEILQQYRWEGRPLYGRVGGAAQRVTGQQR